MIHYHQNPFHIVSTSCYENHVLECIISILQHEF